MASLEQESKDDVDAWNAEAPAVHELWPETGPPLLLEVVNWVRKALEIFCRYFMANNKRISASSFKHNYSNGFSLLLFA